jgi:hypothetical protein
LGCSGVGVSRFRLLFSSTAALFTFAQASKPSQQLQGSLPQPARLELARRSAPLYPLICTNCRRSISSIPPNIRHNTTLLTTHPSIVHSSIHHTSQGLEQPRTCTSDQYASLYPYRLLDPADLSSCLSLTSLRSLLSVASTAADYFPATTGTLTAGQIIASILFSKSAGPGKRATNWTPSHRLDARE